MPWLLYTISNTIGGGVYVGKTGQSIEKRWALHRWRLRRRYHHCAGLQRDWHVAGETAFVFAIAETFDTKAGANEAEQRLIAALRASGATVYNQTDGGDGRRGATHTRQSRQRLSAALKRFYQDPRNREQLGARSRASWAKTRQSRIAKLRAYYATDEARRIKSESSRKRWAKPGERERQSERMRNKLTAEGADRIRTANQQSWGDPERRQQRIERQRAALQRPDEKQRKSEASKRVYADPAQREKSAERMRERWNEPGEREQAQRRLVERYGYTYTLRSPSGDVFTTQNLHDFCVEHGLNSSHMSKVVRGVLKAHKGWTGTRRE